MQSLAVRFTALVKALDPVLLTGDAGCADTLSAQLEDSVQALQRQADVLHTAAEVYAATEARLLELAAALPVSSDVTNYRTPTPAGRVMTPMGDLPQSSIGRHYVTDTGLILEDWFAQIAYGE